MRGVEHVDRFGRGVGAQEMVNRKVHDDRRACFIAPELRNRDVQTADFVRPRLEGQPDWIHFRQEHQTGQRDRDPRGAGAPASCCEGRCPGPGQNHDAEIEQQREPLRRAQALEKVQSGHFGEVEQGQPHVLCGDESLRQYEADDDQADPGRNPPRVNGPRWRVPVWRQVSRTPDQESDQGKRERRVADI